MIFAFKLFQNGLSKESHSLKPTGEMAEKSEDVGYFATVVGMLRKLAEILVKEKVADGQIKTIRDYIDELERIEEKLQEMCKWY